MHHEEGAEGNWEEENKNRNGICSLPEFRLNDADEATTEAEDGPELDEFDDVPLSSLQAFRGESNGNDSIKGQADRSVMDVTGMEVKSVDSVQYMTNALLKSDVLMNRRR